jgi:CRISPR-associated protein Csb1
MLDKIQKAVAEKKPALRARTRFQPMGGPGDVLYPPTYVGGGDPRHQRIINGQPVNCVLLDSVASQANRMEEALLPFEIPRLEMTIGDYQVSSLTAPHRFTDVILRSCAGYPSDVLLDRDKREIFGYSPNSLLMGIWHSNRKGSAGLRIPRSLTSEITGIGIADAPHVGGRLDPLPISSSSTVEIDESVAGWKLAKKGVRPSEALLGSAFDKKGQIQSGRGVTVAYRQGLGLRRIQQDAHRKDRLYGTVGGRQRFLTKPSVRTEMTVLGDTVVKTGDVGSKRLRLSLRNTVELLNPDSLTHPGTKTGGLSNVIVAIHLHVLL